MLRNRKDEAKIVKAVKRDLLALGYTKGIVDSWNLDAIATDDIDNTVCSVASELGIDEDEVRYIADLPR